MFHIRPNKAGLYVGRVAAAVTRRAFDKNVQQDRYLSSPRRAVVDSATGVPIWIFRGKLTFCKNDRAHSARSRERLAAKSYRNDRLASKLKSHEYLSVRSFSLFSLSRKTHLLLSDTTGKSPDITAATFNLRRESNVIPHSIVFRYFSRVTWSWLSQEASEEETWISLDPRNAAKSPGSL